MGVLQCVAEARDFVVAESRVCVVAELEAQAADADDAASRPPANQVAALGEGGESGDIIGGKSLVFATLEVRRATRRRRIQTEFFITWPGMSTWTLPV